MYVVGKLSWLRMLFKYRGTALKRTKARIAFTTGVALVLTIADWRWDFVGEGLTQTPFTLVGVALGIFLGFRNNASYDRFWEGRKLWGGLVNTSRSLTRQILTLIAEKEVELQRELVRRVAAYAHALRLHLRGERGEEELLRLLPEEEVRALRAEPNRPIAILQTLGDRMRGAWQGGSIHALHLPVLENSLVALTDIQGGCERIKNTPIPFSYTALIHSIVAIYCLALPFGLLYHIHHLTPIVVAIVSYAFFGLDAVGDEIEDPFGKDDNDLPLTALSTMIESDVRRRIGDSDLPPPMEPIHGVLV